ncbi:MAG: PepSY domain-containing protein [Allosphingosinicella sp.]
MRKLSIALIAAAALGLSAAAVAAPAVPDRAPTPDERAAIERVLTGNGFVSWDDIELDDGRRWEVDDARLANGEAYDVKLAPGTLRITRRTRDD